MKYSLLLIFSSVCFSLLSQECKWLSYNKNTGTETGRAICTDNNNHVIMAGHYGAPFVLDTFNFNSPTALLVKYNDTGGVIWAAHAIGHCHFSDVEADAANNIYVTGYITGTVDFGNGVKITLPPSVQRSVLVKYNPNGMAQWVNVLSSSSGSGVVETKITVDTENNIIAGFPFNGSVSFQGTGKTLNSAGATDIGIVKYSSSGVYLNSVRFGGVSADNFVELDNDDDDNIYILGNTRSGFTFGQQTLNAGNVIVLKTDSAFSPVTSRGITGDLIDESGISVRNNGEFVITGRVKGTVDFGGKIIAVPNQYCSTRRSYIVYYNEDFTARWIRTDEPVTCGFVDPIGGIFYRDNFIYGGGFLTCSARFGIHITTDPGFNNALYFYKMDTLGNFLWVFASPGAVIGGSFLTDIRADQESDIVFTGYYTDSITVFNKKAINTDHNDHFFAGKIADYNIFRGYVSPGPYCAGDTFIIPYSKKGKFKPGNEFIAQLSDSAGNFDGDERELGRVKDTSGGYIYGKLPLFNVATTNKYRIRIVSTNPSVESFYKFDTLRLLIYSKDTANAGPDISFCRGGSVTLTTTGGSKWHWWPHHGVVKAKDTANRHIQVRPDSTVEYRIIISDSSGCGVTDTDYVKVTVWLRLSVNVADTHYYCAGTTPVVEALINGGIYGATSIKWYDAGDPAKKTLSDSAKLVASPAPHKTYRVVVRDSCSADSTLITVIETAPLLVTVNADTTICAGGTVQVRAAAAGGNTSSHNILWTINNGTWTSGNFAENVTPLITTIYTAKLTDGCSAKPDSAQITVTVRPPLKVTVNTDTTICMGQTVQLRAMLQGGYIPQRTVQWTTEKGTAISSDTIELVNPLTTTTYKAKLTDGCTLNPDSAEIKIIVRPPLKITINADTVICTGQGVQLNAGLQGGYLPGYTIRWAVNGNILPDTTAGIWVSPAQTTDYLAVLRDNCTVNPDSGEVTVTVRPPLQVTATVKDSICAGQQLLLSASLSGGHAQGYKVLWADEWGTWSSSASIATDTPKVTTSYSIKFSDNCSPAVYDTAKVVVLPVPMADLSIQPFEGCPPLSVTFIDISTGNDTAQNKWMVETHEIEGVKQYIHQFIRPGKYHVGLSVSNALGCVHQILKTNAVTVFDKPTADFITKPESKEIEGPVYLYNVSRNATKFTWDMGDGNYLYQNGKKDTVYRYIDTGNIQISLIAQDINGCLDTHTQIIRVFDKITCVIPNAFTPGYSDDLNTVFKPECAGIVDYHLTIYNRWGQVILDCDNCFWNGMYADSPVLPGMYLYRLNIKAESGKKAFTFGTVQVIR